VLVRALAAHGCAALGVRECSLFVLASNTPARRLYARLGFGDAEYPGVMPALDDCLYLVAPLARLLAGPDGEDVAKGDAVADVSGEPETGRACVHTRVIEAPRERVFRAFAEPEHLARWWGPAGFRSTFEVFEPRPGGAWRFAMHGPDGTDYPNESVLREFQPPERVVIEHLSDSHHFLLTIAFEAEGAHTRVHWRQVFDTAEQRDRIAHIVLAANEQNLDRLAAEVARMG
jgi:uncharacterized protein YndB with AHSA1/START domain